MSARINMDEFERPGGRNRVVADEQTTTVPTPDLGWHVINGERLLELLRRAAAGENPDLVYAEEWANADHERVEGRDD